MKYISPDLPKQNSFTLIRLVCCLLVIFDHTWQISGVNSHWATGLGGRLSVPVFFILSGFWVTRSFLYSPSLGIYAKKRFAKIFPMYWIVVAIFALVFYFFSELNAREYFFSRQFLKYLTANISTLNFLCINPNGIFLPYGVNGALWTIKVEVAFYVSLPFIFLFSEKILCERMKMENKEKNAVNNGGGYKILNFFVLTLYFLSVICVFVLPYLIKRFHLPRKLDHQLPSLFCYFAAGMLCLFNAEFILSRGKFFIVPCVGVCVFYLVSSSKFLFPLFPMALAISLFFTGFKISVFSEMKDFSYGMYLVHCPLIGVLSFTNIFAVHPVAGLSFVIGMSFVCSYMLEKVVPVSIQKPKARQSAGRFTMEARP